MAWARRMRAKSKSWLRAGLPQTRLHMVGTVGMPVPPWRDGSFGWLRKYGSGKGRLRRLPRPGYHSYTLLPRRTTRAGLSVPAGRARGGLEVQLEVALGLEKLPFDR